MSITYNVYRNGVKIKDGLTQNTYVDTELTPNTTYEYQVSSVNQYGESPLSNKVVATTDFSIVESVSINKDSIELNVGETETLVAIVSPNTANQDIEWLSSDDEVATVDQYGKVVAVSEGITEITATSVSDTSIADTCVVNVINVIDEGV